MRNPNIRVLLTQNTFTNACKKLSRTGDIVMKNVLFRALWPEVLPDRSCTWKTDAMCFKRDGTYDESTFEAVGTRTQATSRHYNLIIEDDTVAPELEDLTAEMALPSEVDIEQAIGWHKLAVPLLDNPSQDGRIVVGTRWAERDLLSYVEENEPSYKFYKRAALEDEAGNADPDGKPQYPKRFDKEALIYIRDALGPYMFSALYMNTPMSSEAMAFQGEWIHYYDTEPRDLAVYTTVDLASDPKEVKNKQPDYNVVLTTGKSLSTGNIYVLDCWRQRANPGEVIDEIFAQVGRWHPIKVGIESIQYQSTLLYFVRERMASEKKHFSIEGLTHGKRSKEARILGLQPIAAAAKLWFRTSMTLLTSELLKFPLGAFDDMIDALSMQTRMWQQTRSGDDIRREERANDPLSLDSAIRELQERAMPRKGFPFDMQRGETNSPRMGLLGVEV